MAVLIVTAMTSSDRGTLAFTLALQALTQPVESVHTVEWHLDAQ